MHSNTAGRKASTLKPLALTTTTLVALALPFSAHAEDWTGAISNSWFNPANWNSGQVPTAGDDAKVDNSAGSKPRISDNGNNAVADDVTVGDTNTANADVRLNIENGATLTSTAGIIGNLAGSNGIVIVDGTGSTWTSAAAVLVGKAGTGTLTISSGGLVNAIGGGILGFAQEGEGTLNVTGGSWTSTHAMNIGLDGKGTMTIANAGSVTNTYGSIGISTGSIGVVTVNGSGSKWTNSFDLFVGKAGTAQLGIESGGSVSAVNSTLGEANGSYGAVLISGAGSSWSNSGDLIIGNNGTGVVYLGNSATVDVAGTLTIAKNAGSTGQLNIGGGSAAGTLNAATIQFGAGDGTLTFNHTDSNYAFNAAMSGLGTIKQIAGETILTADSSGFTGATDVTGGRLAVNGSLANSVVTVSGGGVLGGNGTVGGIVVQSGGIAGPGNSIGTLNVAGNVSFAAGSIYQVETNPAGQSDKIVATGTATFNGGNVQMLTGSGSYGPSTQYTILSAAGGVTGTFAGVTSDFVFLTPTLSYDPNTVVLSLDRNGVIFADVGATPNQRATGGAVEALGSGNDIYDAVVTLNSNNARGAFDMLSGEMHASIKGVMIEDSRFVREAALDRLRAATSGVGASSAPVVTYADGNPIAASATTDRFVAWGRGFGSWGQADGNGNAATIDRDIGGVLVGADSRIADTWRVGLLGGYSHSTFSVGARNSSAESDDYHAGLYAGTAWGALAFRSGFAYSWHDVSTQRTAAFPGFAEKLNADYGTGTAQVFGELAYELRAAAAVALEPFANIAYVNLSTDGFTETGGAAALTSRDSGTDTAFSTLGLRASSGFVLGNGEIVTAHGMLGWQHAFGDITPTALMAFGGGSPFDIAGVPISEDVALTEAGFDYNIGAGAVLGLTYNGRFGADAVDQSVRGNLNVNF